MAQLEEASRRVAVQAVPAKQTEAPWTMPIQAGGALARKFDAREHAGKVHMLSSCVMRVKCCTKPCLCYVLLCPAPLHETIPSLIGTLMHGCMMTLWIVLTSVVSMAMEAPGTRDAEKYSCRLMNSIIHRTFACQRCQSRQCHLPSPFGAQQGRRAHG